MQRHVHKQFLSNQVTYRLEVGILALASVWLTTTNRVKSLLRLRNASMRTIFLHQLSHGNRLRRNYVQTPGAYIMIYQPSRVITTMPAQARYVNDFFH